VGEMRDRSVGAQGLQPEQRCSLLRACSLATCSMESHGTWCIQMTKAVRDPSATAYAEPCAQSVESAQCLVRVAHGTL
jgi:hypothetical protein